MSKLLPYETIVKAHEGDPDAIDTVLSHYAGYIRYCSKVHGKVSAEVEEHIKQKLIAALLVYVTTSTKFGKRLYALGSNEKAAGFAGINVELTRVLVFVRCGLLVGVAAFLKIAKDTSFDPATSGRNFELYAIAAVVIGGISMSGGRGKIAGVVFGTMSFTLIDKIITAMGMNALLNDSVKGLILLVAVGLQMFKKRSK